MVKFLLNIGAPEAIRPDWRAYADIFVLKAETGSAEALAALQAFIVRAGKGAGSKLAAIKAGDSGEPPAADLPDLALLLPFSLFQGGKKAGEGGTVLAQAANIADISLFCFALPQKAALMQKEDKAIAAAWERAAAFAARHESFLLLPWRQEDYEPGAKNRVEAREAWLQYWLGKARDSNFKGILLVCPLLPAAKRADFIRCSGYFVQKAQQAGLRAGITGALQAPDIPRLLPFAPDYLGLAQPARKQQAILADKCQKVNTMNKMRNKAKTEVAAGAPAGNCDKILVSDFIIPVHIGAYAHEKGTAQPVCFNITAEITRPARLPQTIEHVFSYDIILDAIERFAAAGHIELVETLAEQIAAFLLEFPRVQRVIVRVEKLNLAPRAVGVEISRSREKSD
ncbi:MAG: hypothetical protein DU429_03275 [Candidatus Tokpelaia sp.]|nr:MAG: hypothetical protein DU430_01135 [Candidatus Tokpelaia sp.]KAA6207139.1 MAG: hypothetical protein DU429_03275 [Candidatus Tokpelaia sp.]